MYAIVEIAGQQFKVEEGKKIFVHRMDEAEGNNVVFEKVLLIDNNGEVKVGEPVITESVVEGKVIAHVRGDKVIIFKKKRRKGYQKRSGHRQDFTQVEILSIGPRRAAAPKAPKAEKKEVVEAAAETVKAEVEKAPVKKATASKATASKATASKEVEAKAATTKKPAAKKAAATKAAATKAAAPKAAKKTDKE